jgi:SlyX protein
MTEQPSPGDNGTDQLAALQQQWLKMQESLMHLQHDQQQMHEVLLAQQQEIGRLNANLAKVNGNMERLLSGEEMPTPEDDKPPHY